MPGLDLARLAGEFCGSRQPGELMRRLPYAIEAGVLAVGMLAAPSALAHPHVFVDARAEVVFDAPGTISAVRNIWQFDRAFSEYAIQGLDVDGDGKLSDEELKPLAKVNVESLAEYDFFTFLTVGRNKFAFSPPSEYWLEFRNGRLTLFYTLPLKEPVAMQEGMTLEIFDPEYFVAFSFVKDQPIALAGAPAGCTAEYRPPHALDNDTMSALAAIPREQNLPPELVDAAVGLAHLFALTCP